jgi:signal transduction histidine kinase/streptogramin lyase
MMPESIWGAARDQSGAVFVETIQGRQVKYTPEHGWSPVDSESAAATLYRDGRGQVWEFGIQRRLVRYIHAPAPGGGRIPFSALLEDRERNLWLGAEGQGLYQLRRQFIRTYSVEDGLSHRNVYQVAKDAEGSIWIGAWDGSLSRFRNGCFATFGAADGLPGTAITALFPDRDGTLWVGCNEELRVFDGYRFRKPAAPQVPARATVNAVFRARDGALWMGLSRGLLRYSGGESKLFTVADGLAANDVRVIVESAGGGLWMGGYGGLARFEDGRFRPCAACAGLGGENIRALYEDADGTLWIGTYDGGLGRLKSGKLTRYTVRSGLFSNGAFQILEDSRGNLWMSSNRGIYRAAKRELTDFAEGRRDAVTTAGYARVDGMKNVECNGGYAPAGTVAPDGSLWFPTQDGVAVIDPEKAPRNLTPPPVLIESVLLDRHPVPFDRPVRVPPGAQSIEIQYTALSFIKPELVRFRYRLAELDSAWNEAGRRRTAFYSHVPPGHYVFEVTALSSDGVWNTAGRRLEISVAAPFYRTWQFEALLTLCAAGAVAFAWKWRVAPFERRQAEQRAFSRQLIDSQENERKRIAAELHDSIGQRLVVVKNLAMLFLRRQGQDDAAGGKFAAIEEISSEAGLAIAETREISYNLRPFQLDRLGLTKAVEALVRTASAASQTHFTTELETIDDALPEESRISFYPIVQECLNNIVKHSGASEAKVSIGRAGGQVVMSISDNGRGFLAGAKVSAGSKSGFGLTGMAERASLLGGSFEIRSTPGNGTVATVTIKTGGQRL